MQAVHLCSPAMARLLQEHGGFVINLCYMPRLFLKTIKKLKKLKFNLARRTTEL